MLSNKDEQLFVTLSRINTLLYRQLDKLFRDNGLTTTQFSILEALYTKGDLCIKDIQHTILSTAGNVPLVVDNLVKNNYVLRQKSDTDKRLSVVTLTDIGRDTVTKLYPLQRAILKEAFSSLSKEEKNGLLKQLLPLYQQLQ